MAATNSFGFLLQANAFMAAEADDDGVGASLNTSSHFGCLAGEKKK